MYKSVKTTAEQKFAATQKKAKQAVKEQDKARQEQAINTARLRALRLAKETADKEAAK
jgi:hypothetical protein